MKKRSLVVLSAMMLSFALVCTGCGKEEKEGTNDKKTEESADKEEKEVKEEEDSVLGEWKGRCDMTEYLLGTLEGSVDEKYMEGVEFKPLEFGFVFEFDEEEVTVATDEEVTQEFINNFEDGMTQVAKTAVEAAAEEAGVSVEEILAMMGEGYTMDSYIEEFLESMDAHSFADDFVMEETTGYELQDEVIALDTGEELPYELNGDTLIITMEMDAMEFEIEFERQ